VTSGAGPGQGNDTSGPLSSGEGLHPASNYVGSGSGTGTFTISFSSPVLAVGLFTVDLFNPAEGSGDRVTIQIYDGPNGTGNSLGTFNAAVYNFQVNHQYFMGAGSPSSNIRSLVVNNPGYGGDVFGIDNIEFSGGTSAPVPAASPLSLLIGLAALAATGLLLLSRYRLPA
jgi:hypothetical protein